MAGFLSEHIRINLAKNIIACLAGDFVAKDFQRQNIMQFEIVKRGEDQCLLSNDNPP